MKRRDFFKFGPAVVAAGAAGAVLGKPKEIRKVPVYLVPEDPPFGSLISFSHIKGENVIVDLDKPLEQQFSGRYLERVKQALKDKL